NGLIARVDSKGRVSLPAGIRRTFGIRTGQEIKFQFDLNGFIWVELISNPNLNFKLNSNPDPNSQRRNSDEN
ncbi:MAG: AbrB/MazE/SpoVT family DNA-binding domain-containing protein, partial [Candidatus Diapherotrites archaeon]|nr:AbrB/MazE/SpoVT family DNA-binding domain-containing protein [Candidatus Diapherotrites archaeon]